MKRFFPITVGLIYMGFTLGACTAPQATTATGAAATTVAGAEVALTAADQVAFTYVTQKACPPGKVVWTCSDPATVAKIKSLSLTAYGYVKQAESGVATVQAAMDAINALTVAVPAAPAQ